MITESQIKATVRSVSGTGTAVELKDGGERGAGRLALQVRALKGKVIAEWYAVITATEGVGRRRSAPIPL